MRSSFCLALALALALAAGCAQSAAETVGSPCTRTKDCEALSNGYCSNGGFCTRPCSSHDDCGCSSSTTIDGQDGGVCRRECLEGAAGDIATCRTGCAGEGAPQACEEACDDDAAESCGEACQTVTTNDDIQAGRCWARCAIFTGEAGYCARACSSDKDCEGDLSCDRSGPDDAKEAVGSCL